MIGAFVDETRQWSGSAARYELRKQHGTLYSPHEAAGRRRETALIKSVQLFLFLVVMVRAVLHAMQIRRRHPGETRFEEVLTKRHDLLDEMHACEMDGAEAIKSVCCHF